MSADEYADFLLAEEIASSRFDESFGSDWRTEEEVIDLLRLSVELSFANHGYVVGRAFDEQADEYVQWMVENGSLQKEGDKYTGSYFRLSAGQKNDQIKKYLTNLAVAKRIRTLRSDALPRALRRLAEEHGWDQAAFGDAQPENVDTTLLEIPASDRVVRLDDNHAREIVAATELVIDVLKTENAIDGDIDLRARFIGQLCASRELIRSQSVRVFLLYETVVGVLSKLIEKYKDQAIAEAAKKLLDLLIEHILGK